MMGNMESRRSNTNSKKQTQENCKYIDIVCIQEINQSSSFYQITNCCSYNKNTYVW